MKNYFNKLIHRERPVTLIGLNSKLIFRGLLFYFNGIVNSLLVVQFLLSFMTLDFDFYFKTIPTVKGIAYLFLVAILVEILIKVSIKTEKLASDENPSNITRDTVEILKEVFVIRKVKLIAFLMGIIMLPINLQFLFSSKSFNLSDKYEMVRDVFYHANVEESTIYYYLFFFIMITSWIYLSTSKSIYEDEMINHEDLELAPEIIEGLHKAVTAQDWENKVLKLLFKPDYHNLIRVYKIEERYEEHEGQGDGMTVVYSVYAETISGIPIRPTTITIRFPDESYEDWLRS